MTDIILSLLLQIHELVGSLGWAIIAFTVIVRSLLLPITLPSMRKMRENQKKQKSLKKEVNKLKKKYKDDAEKLQKAQLELYKKHNINPLAGCLPQIVQLGLLIILYRALLQLLGSNEYNGVVLNTMFYGFELTQTDSSFVLPIIAASAQMFMSLMIAPGGETPDIIPNDSKKKSVQKANEKEEDTAEMAQAMQQQMIFIMPVMTGFLALRFPAGLVLYWITTTIFSIGQQYAISGAGGLVIYGRRARGLVQKVL